MKPYQVEFLLELIANRHDCKQVEENLKVKEARINEIAELLWMPNVTEHLSAKHAANQVLKSSEAKKSLIKLVSSDWFYLDWILPEHEARAFPESQENYRVALKTSEFSPPYTFIGVDQFVYLKPEYRSSDYYDRFEVKPMREIIESALNLKRLMPKSQWLPLQIVIALKFVRANEHIVS